MSVLGRGSLVPAIGLAWLSLPIVPLLQLHLGFPLRAAVTRSLAWMASPISAFDGLRAEGAALVWNGRWILVDEPCSGVRLLWTSLFVASLLALIMKLSARRSAALIVFSGGLAVLFQGLRIAGLAAAEWRGLAASARGALHDMSGVAAAALLFAATCLGAHYLGRLGHSVAPAPAPRLRRRRPGQAIVALGMTAAAIAPVLSQGWAKDAPESLLVSASTESFPGWPATFEGTVLDPIPLASEDAAFQGRFRGRLARFARGSDEVILAWTREPSADMHSTVICLRGAGYAVTPEPAFLDPDGSLWARFTARRGPVEFTARERIRDERGGSWSDLSAWWWAALLGRTNGPWWKELVVSRRGQMNVASAPLAASTASSPEASRGSPGSGRRDPGSQTRRALTPSR